MKVKSISKLLILMAIGLFPQISLAQGVGNPGSLPFIIPQNPGTGGWNVGSAAAPIPPTRPASIRTLCGADCSVPVGVLDS